MTSRDLWREFEELLPELEAALPEGYTGQIVLNCNTRRVLSYDLKETRRPEKGPVLLSEGRRQVGR